ncbi:MAG: hypothetical protein ABI119_13735 [Gemmatimonadaceae bacterium]
MPRGRKAKDFPSVEYDDAIRALFREQADRRTRLLEKYARVPEGEPVESVEPDDPTRLP